MKKSLEILIMLDLREMSIKPETVLCPCAPTQRAPVSLPPFAKVVKERNATFPHGTFKVKTQTAKIMCTRMANHK